MLTMYDSIVSLSAFNKEHKLESQSTTRRKILTTPRYFGGRTPE